jgi:LacI family transcriptional regulator
MTDLDMFCCQNHSCSYFGLRGAGTLSVCGHYGKQKRRLLYCNCCKTRFSERKGTSLFDSRLPEDKVQAIFQHIARGCSVRETALLVGVSKDTVARYRLRAGQQVPAGPSEEEASLPEAPSVIQCNQDTSSMQ